VIGTGPYVTAPSLISHDWFADRSMHASTPAPQGTPAGGGGAFFTIVAFAAATSGSGGICTGAVGGGAAVVAEVLVASGFVGSGAAVSVVAHADSSPTATTANPKSARMPSPSGARYREDAYNW
jgi:hypothetical protein